MDTSSNSIGRMDTINSIGRIDAMFNGIGRMDTRCIAKAVK
jgi:hypothetical protein